mmetsp:Transcript_70394/g.198668  ORF Transcript_70394/g.198668 Transcript_70394/m.198668 type:complete len:335 (+) Transcript_70394:61-1065(+)
MMPPLSVRGPRGCEAEGKQNGTRTGKDRRTWAHAPPFAAIAGSCAECRSSRFHHEALRHSRCMRLSLVPDAAWRASGGIRGMGARRASSSLGRASCPLVRQLRPRHRPERPPLRRPRGRVDHAELPRGLALCCCQLGPAVFLLPGPVPAHLLPGGLVQIQGFGCTALRLGQVLPGRAPGIRRPLVPTARALDAQPLRGVPLAHCQGRPVLARSGQCQGADALHDGLRVPPADDISGGVGPLPADLGGADALDVADRDAGTGAVRAAEDLGQGAAGVKVRRALRPRHHPVAELLGHDHVPCLGLQRDEVAAVLVLLAARLRLPHAGGGSEVFDVL